MKNQATATLCIYHANCADGFGAAWVVRKAQGPDVEFHSAHYGDPAPDVTGKNVIIVDFSYKYDVLVELADKAASVLVIDHHKTAIADLADVPPAELHFEAQQKNSTGKLHALFDMNRSGAGLTWDFFFPVQPRPPLINHIEDRDLWLFKLEGTREIMADLFSYPQDFATWDRLFADEINWIRLDGVAINRQHQKTVADLVRTTKRCMLIGGHDVPVANLPFMFASDAGAVMAEGELFSGSYFDTPDGRSFSLRSTDAGMDVSEIAKQYGGGGHRNAAGFKVSFDHSLAQGRVTGQVSAVETPEVLAVVAKTESAFPETMVIHRDAIDAVPLGTELIDRAHFTRLQAEISALRGLTPGLPPRPPEGQGLPRYGLRWNGPSQPLAVPMEDGYWTPWHLADQFRTKKDDAKEINQ
ncbi:DHHA1 domain-containing protein [Pseudomonas sp. GM67]|uniref:DHHA1 domain-containing protein n=1 Tax=Pseudomonas sp. GM67 TaxID=1144335 RepID=UPI000270CB05|nr:DHHA1 domain-containing protein [Pseudomonas sp. GM67]EJM94710.1 putative DHD superfamily phosphohydrolase [Pseudomonas sp. GM67]